MDKNDSQQESSSVVESETAANKLIDYQEPFLTSEKLEETLKEEEASDEQFIQEQLEQENLVKKTRFKVKKIDFTMSKNQQSKGDGDKDGDKERKTSTNSSANSSQAGENESECNTQHLKSLRHYTREPLPKVSHYRNTLSLNTHQNRPSLDELHNPVQIDSTFSRFTKSIRKRSSERISSSGVIKLGWIQGVLVRCLLNIWGVMLFLRLPWVVGQSGVIQAILIMLLATLVTTITTVSMSAICTNGEVKGGGAYYMISRSLGSEFGGAIGAIFSLANAVAVSMYVVGFCESLLGLLTENDITIIDGGLQDIRVIGLITVTVLLGIAIIGMEWENKAQIFLLIILLSAMFNFMIGTFFPPDINQKAQGFFGYTTDLFFANMFSNYKDHNFISVFSIIFPAATGILAGANISGDLKKPSEAIPKGTFLAIFITTCSYILFMILCGFTMTRDANGIIKDYLTIQSVSDCKEGGQKECQFGLMNSDKVMIMISPFPSVIYGGIFAATLSSALASLVSAPKVFQALCKDNLFPYIHVFGKEYGKNKEPKRAYLLTYVIAICCILIGQLNAIAPIISNFFLAAYTIINFSCFHVSFSKSPGFRPAFKYYNKWMSLVGSVLCLGVMFIINWYTALLTFALILFLFIYIHYRKPDVNWGSSTQAEAYMRALKACKRMIDVPDHVKTFRPQILCLTGTPAFRPALLDFADCVTRKMSLLVAGHIICNLDVNTKTRRALTQRAVKFFHKRKVDSFYEIKTENSFSEGAKALMELSGLGKLRPNLLLIGYKQNWLDCPLDDLLEYFKTIHYAFDLHYSVCILRVPGGLDVSEYDRTIDDIGDDGISKQYLENEAGIELIVQGTSDRENDSVNIPRNASSAQLSNVLRPTVSWFELLAAFKTAGGDNSTTSTPRLSRNLNYSDLKSKEDNETSIEIGQSSNAEKSKSINLPVSEQKTNNDESRPESFYINVPSDKQVSANEIAIRRNIFKIKQKKGTIDVWWLYDDGGLTLLIPHIIANRNQFENCTLRVFTLANRKDELDREKRNMATLLSKFRIGFSDVTAVPDIVKPPKEETVKEFEKLISKFIVNENSKGYQHECSINEADLMALKDKNNRHIRLRELLLEHSKDASLIVMTLTVPRKGTCSAPLFMAWLEILTSNMPPFLLVRGNQTSVLTFYS